MPRLIAALVLMAATGSLAQGNFEYPFYKLTTWVYEAIGKPCCGRVPKCLDVNDGNAYAGARVQWYDCVDWAYKEQHQLWHVESADKSNLVYKDTKLCLDVGGANFSHGAPLQL